jgi:chromosome segregation ATPase
VEDRDPIKQIQHLLDDPNKVLEKISRIRCALGSIDEPNAEAPPVVSSSEAARAAKSETETYEDLLQMLRDMQSQIEERLRPLAEQAVQTEARGLNEWMERERRALDECMARIDRNLLACVERINDSKNRYFDLTVLKRRLEELGVATSSLPELSTTQDAGEIIKARLETLRRDGKI